MTAPSFDGATALREHREKLLEKREQLDMLIANVDKTIALTEGRMKILYFNIDIFIDTLTER